MTISPLAYYSEKLKAAQTALHVQTQRHQSLANARLIVFLVGLLLSLIAAAWSGYASVAVAVVFLVIFAVLVARYRQAVAEANAQQAMVNYYQRGIARLEDRWSELSKEPLHNPADSHHPYSLILTCSAPVPCMNCSRSAGRRWAGILSASGCCIQQIAQLHSRDRPQ